MIGHGHRTALHGVTEYPDTQTKTGLRLAISSPRACLYKGERAVATMHQSTG